MLTPADRITLLAARGVTVALTPDGQDLDVSGNAGVILMAEPMLRHFKPALIAHLARPCVGDRKQQADDVASAPSQRLACPEVTA